MKILPLLILACGLFTVTPSPGNSATPSDATAAPEKKMLTPTQALKLLESRNFFHSSALLDDNKTEFCEVAARFRKKVGQWKKTPEECADYPWVAELLHMAFINNTDFLILPDILQSFISISADINAEDSYGKNAMDYALSCSVKQFFEPLLKAGAKADVNRSVENGMTALFYAVEQGDKKTAEYLLQQGSYVNDINGHGETVLSVALLHGHPDIADMLIKAGAKTDFTLEDDMGLTLLHQAAEGGCAEQVKLFISQGANPGQTTAEEKWTPLMLAASQGHTEIVAELLKHHVDIKAKCAEGKNALAYALERAIVSDSIDCVNLLLQESKKRKIAVANLSDYLWDALLRRQSNLAHLLLLDGAEFDAEQDGWRFLNEALCCRNEQLLRLLEEKGAQFDVHTPNDFGMTQLMLAAENGFEELVERFLEEEADAKAVDDNGENVMIYALRGGNEEIIRMLRDAGAVLDAKATTTEKETQLMLAARHGMLPEVQELLKLGSAVNARSVDGHTALMEALSYGHVEVVQELLKSGASLNSHHKPGMRTLLMCAAQGDMQDIMRILLKKGSDPNDVIFPSEDSNTPNGTTALMLAAENGHDKAVRLLLSAGAIPRLLNEHGECAADLARENGHTALADFLESQP